MSAQYASKPVAIIIPCRNEEKYIGSCLNSLLANDYPKELLEIIVVDGMSTDLTREIVQEYSNKYSFIKMIDNPKFIQSAALNLGIKSTSCKIIMRFDAHTFFPPDYVSRIVYGLIQHKTDNFGGCIEIIPGENTSIARGLALANSHRFSVGNAYYRIGCDKLRSVDTVPFGCYRRETFDHIGYFNENLTRAEDREFNARLLQNGSSIVLDPTVKCTYVVRSKLSEYLKWMALGGYWVFYASRFTNTKMRSWRNYIPLLFLLYHFFVGTSLFIISSKLVWLLLTPLFLYWIMVLYFSAKVALTKKAFFYFPLLFIIFPATHYSYAFASLYGLIKAKILGKDLLLC